MYCEAIMSHRQHIKNANESFFNELPAIDWNYDFASVSTVTENIIRKFAEDKDLFRRVLMRVPNERYLWEKCEEDVTEDKIVLWDDVDKNIRIRLRMSTKPQQRLAHSHRFSFTNLVLRGRYTHWVYMANEDFHPEINIDDVREVVIQEDKMGDCFSIHHETLHSTPFTEEETISLVLRGNPLKRRAPVVFKESRGREEALFKLRDRKDNPTLEKEPDVALKGDGFWRIGQDEEDAERRNERQMSRDRFDYWCGKLEEYGLI